MARRLTVVVSQGQSANPAKRKLEEDIVTALLFEKGIEVTVVPHLYDLKPDGTGMLALHSISGDMVFLSWLFPRAAFWTMHRAGVKGKLGTTIIEPELDDDEAEEVESTAAEESAAASPDAGRDVPNRRIYCLDLRWHSTAEPYVQEIKRIASESAVQTFDLLGSLLGNGNSNGNGNNSALPIVMPPRGSDADANGNGTRPGDLSEGIRSEAPSSNGQAKLQPNAGGGANETSDAEAIQAKETSAIQRIEESTGRRWYPVIDFSRCTNCMECLDFCLFGVYGVDRFESILVEQPDNCRKGCPACSRVCPENAIIFPQHKSPTIAGSPEKAEGSFKIDLSKLFGAPDDDPMATAVAERDRELLAAGRDAVGATVGMPKRQAGKTDEPKDDLDSLMDELDDLNL